MRVVTTRSSYARLVLCTAMLGWLSGCSSTASGVEVVDVREKGRYLSIIGACEACHTPPRVPATPPAAGSPEYIEELQFRADPDWFRYLDDERRLAGGVPFIMRFSATSSGVVYTPNITPDEITGIGTWSVNDIVKALRTGVRPDGQVLFAFPPHSFYKNLAKNDAIAIAEYLLAQPAVNHQVQPRSLPFPPSPMSATSMQNAPQGRNTERAMYLMKALIGCRECHSHAPSPGAELIDFVGGDPSDPFTGVFRLGPDLPLRQNEPGFAAFPYPGYAVLYGPNLTRFGLGGSHAGVSSDELVKAIRRGISPHHDRYERPELLHSVMLWQFYASMADDDAYAIAEFIKSLRYQPHAVPGLTFYGEDWEAAFQAVFGEPPSSNDRLIFGKP